MRFIFRITILLNFFFCISFVGCAHSAPVKLAPVENAWLQPRAQKSSYIVKKEDTLYSIAWAFGLDYRALAAVNHLRPPYHIYPGQRLLMANIAEGQYKKSSPPIRVRSPNSLPAAAHPLAKLPRPVAVKAKPPVIVNRPINKKTFNAKRVVIKSKPFAAHSVINRPPPRSSRQVYSRPIYFSQKIRTWLRPTQGRIIQGYSNAMAGNHGLNFAGIAGQTIRAAAAGQVVYSGKGVRGYGNLIIVKHNNDYLSAYAYNQQMLVRVGQFVSTGQTIATMGRDDSGRVLLHFEIRHRGNPVDPLTLLH